jgi:hypothetical protein
LNLTSAKRWLVERGIEIISEASRHLSDELKARHPEIHGRKLPGSATCCAMNTSMSRTMCSGTSFVTICHRSNGLAARSWRENKDLPR